MFACWHSLCLLAVCMALGHHFSFISCQMPESTDFFGDNDSPIQMNPWDMDPEAHMTVFEMIRYNGYPAESHDVVTEDGYILNIQRIPFGKNGPGVKPRQPVIVQHGFLCSSAIWVFNGRPEGNLGYLLADAGYDVWLTNIRGNDFGQKHQRLTPLDDKFWEFSFDEMAKYDMPAMVDFILQKTKFNQTNYIGHSMGTTILLTMLSIKPEYNGKIHSAMLMAPVASVQHLSGPMRRFKPFRHYIDGILQFLGGPDLLSTSSKLINLLTDSICSSPIREVCESLTFVILGFNEAQFNLTRLPVYLTHTPSDTSVQNFVHYMQWFDPGFRWMDFGPAENMKRYGQATAPFYSLNDTRIPVAIFWGENDILADPIDVAELAPQIPNLVIKYKVPDPKFTHADFMWAMDAKRLVYDKVIDVMKKLWKE